MELQPFLGRLPAGDLWVYGYGSLMWSPGFHHVEKGVALLRGYHRALCILSTRYRGTETQPGLVMGLCRGGSCWGMAFRARASNVGEALRYLWQREMLRQVYQPRLVPVLLQSGARVRALTFVANATHPQFARELDLNDRAQLVAQGIGERGRCTDYIRRTLEHMYALGVTDPHLERVLETAEAIRSSAATSRAR